MLKTAQTDWDLSLTLSYIKRDKYTYLKLFNSK